MQTRDEALSAIDSIDLGPVVTYVMKKLEWTPERIDAAAKKYREYLRLCLINRGECHTPSEDVDQIWHAHILHTKKYAEDCQKSLGFFLHHYPFTVRSAGSNCTDCGDGCDCGD